MSRAFDKHGRVVAHDNKYTGEEPKWDNISDMSVEAFERRRSIMFNFYTYYLDAKELKTITLQWMKKNGYTKEQISKVKSLDNTTPSTTVGKICRANLMGMPLKFHEDHRDGEFVKNEIAKALTQATPIVVDTDGKTSAAKLQKKVLNPAELLKEKVYAKIISELDRMIDDGGWDFDDKPTTINLFNLLKGEAIPVNALGPVVRWLELYRNEYNDALNKNCEDAVEACSHLTKVGLKNRVKTLDNLLADVDKYKATLLKKRAPRKKKAVTADKQVKKLKYMTECNENKITSVSPLNLPGSKESYFYNTKNKKLIVVNSPGGLTVKGSSLIGFDEKESYTITLRKPETVLLDIVSGGKRKVDNVLNSLTTKRNEFNGRLNDKILILKVRS